MKKLKELLWYLLCVPPVCIVIFLLIHIVIYDVGKAPEWILIAEWISIGITWIEGIVGFVIAVNEGGIKTRKWFIIIKEEKS